MVWYSAATTAAAARAAWLGGAVLVGCTSTVTPPVAPLDPTPVFVLREALHVGLVLPDGEPPQRYVEYGFGDWSYYALGRDAWYHLFATVLWPTPGALSRRVFAAHDADEFARVASWVELDRVVVSRDRVERLRERLEAEVAGRADAAVWRSDAGMQFAPADRGYWFLRTCADVAADWLRELDCAVGWAPIRTSLAVAR